MRVFLTGASGFIGSQVARDLLSAGHDVAALVVSGVDLSRIEESLPRMRVIEGTLQELSATSAMLRDWKPDACLHLAWYTEPGKYLESLENLDALQGSLDVLQAMHACGCRYVLAAGTCAEYERKSELLSEEDSTKPESLYGAAKLAFLVAAQQLAPRLGIDLAWARLFFLYGPREDPRRLVPSAVLSLHGGKPFSASPGAQVRDFLHVEDVSRGLLAILARRATGIYNVCSAQPISVAELLETIGKLMNRGDLIRLGEVPYREWEPEYLCGSNRKLQSLGWKASMTLREGLQRTIDWWNLRAE